MEEKQGKDSGESVFCCERKRPLKSIKLGVHVTSSWMTLNVVGVIRTLFDIIG